MAKQTPIVFFNASVILAGLKAPTGGSGKLLGWGKERKIVAVTSEIVLDEVLRNVGKVGLGKKRSEREISKIFKYLYFPPEAHVVKAFEEVVIDYGDAHVLASAHQAKADFLVTLDKKHLLALKKKIKGIKIVSPGELIEKLS